MSLSTAGMNRSNRLPPHANPSVRLVSLGSSSGWMRINQPRKKNMKKSKRVLKHCAILSLPSCTKVRVEPMGCLAVCLVCPEVCLVCPEVCLVCLEVCLVCLVVVCPAGQCRIWGNLALDRKSKKSTNSFECWNAFGCKILWSEYIPTDASIPVSLLRWWAFFQ
jgi:hypothetical protein